MNLVEVIATYIVYTVITIGFQIGETIHHERVYINQGGSPLGDSTYISYLSILITRLIASGIGIGIAIYWHLSLPNNFWLFILWVALIYLILTAVGATVQAIVSTFLIRRANRRVREHMIDNALKANTDTKKTGTDK